jgi:hypothetical protein
VLSRELKYKLLDSFKYIDTKNYYEDFNPDPTDVEVVGLLHRTSTLYTVACLQERIDSRCVDLLEKLPGKFTFMAVFDGIHFAFTDNRAAISFKLAYGGIK